jgi:Uma2 family endonuclease
MPTTLAFPSAVDIETSDQSFIVGGIDWSAYVTISDALDEHLGVRMIYCDGRLTLVGKSRKHDWHAERLGELAKAMARVSRIPWEDAGTATFRRKNLNAGLEGEKTYYLGDHAVQMRGPDDIDLTVQPPPDLAIEVEVAHSADLALVAWGRIGVPEVWRFRPKTSAFMFCHRTQDGSYVTSDRSLSFPVLSSSDVLEQMRMANELGADLWNEQLEEWVGDVIRPRLERGE